jgi:hypothetical protein
MTWHPPCAAKYTVSLSVLTRLRRKYASARPSAKGQSELSLLEENGHEFHIDARPRGSSAKNIDGQSFRFAVFDLGKWRKATIMSNPDRLIFKHCSTVDVGLGSISTELSYPHHVRLPPIAIVELTSRFGSFVPEADLSSCTLGFIRYAGSVLPPVMLRRL